MESLIKNKNISSEYILNSLQSPILVINSINKKIIYCNNSTEIFLETSKKNIINQKINNIDHPTNIACKKLLNINENLIF